MKHLQWFPGHMTAAVRMMEENLKAVDGVIVVLDARAPFSSVNRKLDGLFKDKKILYVLNKCDLVENKDALSAIKKFREENKAAVAVCAADKRSVDALYDALLVLFKDKLARNKEKGIFKPMRVMVAGIPNTGKSTIINALSGGKKTQTGNKAGITRGKQWVRLKELEFLDTPGTMPPAFDDQQSALRLAYIGSMNDANIDFNDLAFELLKELLVKYPELLKARYGTEGVQEPLDAMHAICGRRGFLLKGGDYDYDRCAAAIIDDFRKGRIGKIFLD